MLYFRSHTTATQQCSCLHLIVRLGYTITYVLINLFNSSEFRQYRTRLSRSLRPSGEKRNETTYSISRYVYQQSIDFHVFTYHLFVLCKRLNTSMLFHELVKIHRNMRLIGQITIGSSFDNKTLHFYGLPPLPGIEEMIREHIITSIMQGNQVVVGVQISNNAYNLFVSFETAEIAKIVLENWLTYNYEVCTPVSRINNVHIGEMLQMICICVDQWDNSCRLLQEVCYGYIYR